MKGFIYTIQHQALGIKIKNSNSAAKEWNIGNEGNCCDIFRFEEATGFKFLPSLH